MRYLLLCFVLICGCGLTPATDTDKPNPTPDTPSVNVIKAPAEAYWKQYAVWVEKKFIASPQELAQNARQLQLVGLISPEDYNALEAVFPGCLKDAKPFADVKAAADKLREMK